MQENTSVIIVSYHTGEVLWQCLVRTLQLHGVQDVVLVDNGNPPHVLARLQEMAAAEPRLKLISGHGNVGFSRGCNLGAAVAEGAYFLFLNPDAVMEADDGITRMIALLQRDVQPPVGMVGAILRNEDGSEQRASRRNLISPCNSLAEGLGLTRLGLPGINITSPLPAEPFSVGAISGSCMLLSCEDFRAVGGFDEGYFLHVEDVDLCQRIWRAGKSIWVDPSVNILHFRSTSEVSSLFVERHKTAGFHRYFDLYFVDSQVLRPVAKLAATLRYGLKCAVSKLRAKRG
jgi:N-acetylglucosaminyl-diphospho-decaprenol L-rhamnosyltransferase